MATVDLVLRRGDEPALELRFAQTEITFGRSPRNDVVLPHAGVSKHHARLLVRNDKIYADDVGSTNGTFLNGERLQAPELVKEGDRLLIAGFVVEATVRRGETAESRKRDEVGRTQELDFDGPWGRPSERMASQPTAREMSVITDKMIRESTSPGQEQPPEGEAEEPSSRGSRREIRRAEQRHEADQPRRRSRSPAEIDSARTNERSSPRPARPPAPPPPSWAANEAIHGPSVDDEPSREDNSSS